MEVFFEAVPCVGEYDVFFTLVELMDVLCFQTAVGFGESGREKDVSRTPLRSGPGHDSGFPCVLHEHSLGYGFPSEGLVRKRYDGFLAVCADHDGQEVVFGSGHDGTFLWLEPGKAVRPCRIVLAGRLLSAFDFKGLAGLGVLDGAVLLLHEEGDLVGTDFHASFPFAVFGLVGVVL